MGYSETTRSWNSRLPGQLVSACPDSLAHHPKCALSSETRASHRLPLIPLSNLFLVWVVCRHVGCVGFLREFLWRPLPERVLERGYTAYTPTHPRKFCSVSIEEGWN